MTQFNPRSVKGNQTVLFVVREFGPEGSNAGAIADRVFDHGFQLGEDRVAVYRRTLRALKALLEQGLIRKVGLNYIAQEREIEEGLTRQLSQAVALVASSSAAVTDAGLLRAALQGVMDDLDRRTRATKAPMVGKELAEQVLGE